MHLHIANVPPSMHLDPLCLLPSTMFCALEGCPLSLVPVPPDLLLGTPCQWAGWEEAGIFILLGQGDRPWLCPSVHSHNTR